MTMTSVRTIRTLHLIDLENLANGPHRPVAEFLDVLDRYRSVARMAPHDLVEVAVDASGWKRVAHALPRSWRVRVGYGRDGADRALLTAVDPRVATDRFDRIVVGSGDGAFVGLVLRLKYAGQRVEVVSRRSSLSLRLARVASLVVPLPEPTDSPPPFAIAA